MSSTPTRRALGLTLAAALTTLMIVGIDALARPEGTQVMALSRGDATHGQATPATGDAG